MASVRVKTRRGLMAVAAVVMSGSFAGSARAGVIDWASAVSGSFQDTTMWTGGVVPSDTTNDNAEFNVAGTFTVSYTANAGTNSFTILQGAVTFDLGTFKYTLGTTAVNGGGGISGPSAPALTITNGTVFMARTGGGGPAITVGSNVAGETGKLTVSTGGILDFGVRGVLLVGFGAGAGTVDVINGGKVFGNNQLNVGSGTGPASPATAPISTLNVTGKGSLVDWWGGLNVGTGDNQNAFANISTGGIIAPFSFALGKSTPTNTHATMTISGKDGDGVSSQLQFKSNTNTVLASGTLNVSNGGVVTTWDANARNLTVNAGGTVNLGGNSTFSNKGTVTVNGNLNVSHLKNQFVSTALTMGTGSSLNIALDVDGANQPDAYLNVGTMTMSSGGINVTLQSGYDPALGASFNLLDWTTLNGGPLTTANVHLPTLSSNWVYWDTSSLGTTGVVAVAPEPSVMGLLAVVGLAGLRRRRVPRA